MQARDRVLKAIRWHQAEIVRLNRRIAEITESAASASLSSGEGSKSYTNHSLAELRKLVADHQRSVVALENRLSGDALPVRRRVYTTRR